MHDGQARPFRDLGLIVGVAAFLAISATVAVKLLWRTQDGRREGGGSQVGSTAQDGRAALPSEPPAPAPTAAAPTAGVQPDPTGDDLKAEAMAVVRQLMADFPGYSDPMALMGTLYRRLQNDDEAEKWWLKCLQRNPERADAYIGLARVAESKGNLEKALEMWRKAQQLNPRMPGAYSGYAATLLEIGRADEAIAALEKEAGIPPEDGRCFALLGRAYAQRREHRKAADCYRQAIDLQPEESANYYGLANAYTRLGQKDKADLCLEEFKALRADEDAGVTRRKMAANDRNWSARIGAQTLTDAGVFYAGHGNTRKAQELWRRAAALDPRNRESRQRLVDAYGSTGRLQEAVAFCEQLRAIAPRNAQYQLNTGVLLAGLQQFDAAEAALRRAVELAPKRPAGYLSLVRLLLVRKRNLAEAKALAEQLVALEPSAPNYSLLAEACHRNGDVAGARAALRRALDLEPGNMKIDKAPKEPAQPK